MKQGWEIKKLSEVCELSAGGDVPKDNFSEIKTEKYQIPIYANGEKNDGFYGYTSIAKVTKPSITVSARGTIGFSVKRLEAFFPVVRLIVVIPINLNELNLDYLDYTIKTIDFKHSGSSIPQLTVPMIRDYKIPLPPLPEQQRIVSILDEAFAAIAKAKANAEQNLKNAKELFESYLQGVFENKGDGWEEKRLGGVVNKIKTGPFGSMLHQSDYVDDGIPVVNPQNIVDGKIIPLSKTMINHDTFKGLENYALKLGDIVIARRGEMGRCAVVRQENVNWLCGTGSFVIRVNSKKIDSDFLNVILSSNSVKQQLEKSSIGATMSNLNQTILSELPIRIPNVEHQQTIVRQLDALRAETKRLEAIYQQKLLNLEELKNSILQKAFAGELKTEEAVAV